MHCLTCGGRKRKIFRPLSCHCFPVMACRPETLLPCSFPVLQGTITWLCATHSSGVAWCCWRRAEGRGRAADQLRTLQLARPQCCGQNPTDTEFWACRVAVTVWRAIVSSRRTAEKVLPELLCVLEDWPLHSTSTSDKDNTDVFPLAVSFWARPKHILKGCPSGISAFFVSHPSLHPVPHIVF